MANLLKIALGQFLSGCDPALIIAEARRGDADIVVFPGMYSNGYARFNPKDGIASEGWHKGALSVDSGFIDQFREAAKKCRFHAVATFWRPLNRSRSTQYY